MIFRELDVLYDNGLTATLVGRLAANGAITVFEYDDAWIQHGIELSPFDLPIEKRSHQLNPRKMVAATFGLFADSLPDGWGMLIMDRFFKKKGIDKNEITPIDRLAFLGSHAMGALRYHPPLEAEQIRSIEAVHVGDMAREAYDLYEGRIENAGRLLAQIGGSPGGARPKALIGISDEKDRFVSGTGHLPDGYSHWFVKFSGDAHPYDGVLELIYNKMAKNAGITVPEHFLISDDNGVQHIATRRFDRLSGNRRRHSATACGLLHADYMAPTLDYEVLMKVAWKLTQSAAQVEEQFKRAVFNLFAINRDDHAKNHGYVMSDDGRWELSPAYDLTCSSGPHSEHWTSYSGEGKNPGVTQLHKVAKVASIHEKTAHSIIDQVKTAVATFKRLALEHDVPVKTSNPITSQIEKMLTMR
jgi:serine/threonine-protein kinase HipA